MKLTKVDEGFAFIGDEDVPSCHASSIAQLPDGTLVAVWYAGKEEGSPDSGEYMAVKRPNADGWHPYRVFINVPDWPAGNPRIYLDAAGRLVVMYTICYGRWCRADTLYTRFSTNGALTWSRPREIPFNPKVLGKNPPVVYPDGRIVAPITVENMDYGASCIISDDNGETWRMVGALRGREEGQRVLQPTIAPLADGSLLMLLRTNMDRIWRSRSTDRGETWSPPEPTDLPHNRSGICMIRHSSGNVFLALNPVAEGRTPLAIFRSPDEGASWHEAVMLEDGPGEYSYPTLIEGIGGLIHIIYTWRRERIKWAALRID
ncbi:MAG TPA: exo-alpha-sialidase [Candidatus Brocadiia bacterium]|nr:exo-alpha-sialidase [Candidatus Brocadiia bacterium]